LTETGPHQLKVTSSPSSHRAQRSSLLPLLYVSAAALWPPSCRHPSQSAVQHHQEDHPISRPSTSKLSQRLNRHNASTCQPSLVKMSVPPSATSTSNATIPTSRKTKPRQLRPTATLYEASSQYRRWTYDSNKLTLLRRVINQRAVEACKDNFKEEEVRSPPSVPSMLIGHSFIIQRLRAELPEGSKATFAKTPESYPTAADEAQLVRHYITSMRNLLALGILSDASGGRPIPPVVETIAITYLKRFYVRTSCLEYHPRNVMSVIAWVPSPSCRH
jgi:hypothetical protein